MYGVDFIFLLLNCNNYRVEACALKMGIAHRVVCRDVLCEAKMLLNLIPSSLALFSLFRSICYVFTYCFQTKDQYLLFHNSYMVLYFPTTTRAPHYTNFYLSFIIKKYVLSNR